MKFISKFIYGRFSKDEHKQLHKILSEESKVLLKRPQYIIGNIIIAGLVFYFTVRAFGPETFEWPKMGNVVGIAADFGTSLFLVWLIFVKLLKVKNANTYMVFWSCWSLWMIAFISFTKAQPSSKTKWSYLIYAALTLVGWLCSCGSIKEHLSEKILMARKKTADPTIN